MTNSELIDRLQQAQALLADVYAWADTPTWPDTPMAVWPLKTNAEIAGYLSTADSCIQDALEVLYDQT
jgi:hypothetical protein